MTNLRLHWLWTELDYDVRLGSKAHMPWSLEVGVVLLVLAHLTGLTLSRFAEPRDEGGNHGSTRQQSRTPTTTINTRPQ